MTRLFRMALLLTLAALAPSRAGAEVEVGTIEVGGASVLGYSASRVETDAGGALETTTWGLEVGGLYYVTPQVGVGLEFAYDKTTLSDGFATARQTTILLGPKVGLHQPLGDGLALFGEALVGFAQLDTEGSQPKGFAFGLGGGLKVFLSPGFSADLGLRWRRTELEDGRSGAKATSTDLFVGAGFSVYLGPRR